MKKRHSTRVIFLMMLMQSFPSLNVHVKNDLQSEPLLLLELENKGISSTSIPK